MKLQRAEILVSGLVQGVSYRFFAERLAKRYGLRGFCRNLPNGMVESVVEGDGGLISDYVKGLKRGPISASVSAVSVRWLDYKGEFDRFEIRFC